MSSTLQESSTDLCGANVEAERALFLLIGGAQTGWVLQSPPRAGGDLWVSLNPVLPFGAKGNVQGTLFQLLGGDAEAAQRALPTKFLVCRQLCDQASLGGDSAAALLPAVTRMVVGSLLVNRNNDFPSCNKRALPLEGTGLHLVAGTSLAIAHQSTGLLLLFVLRLLKASLQILLIAQGALRLSRALPLGAAPTVGRSRPWAPR